MFGCILERPYLQEYLLLSRKSLPTTRGNTWQSLGTQPCITLLGVYLHPITKEPKKGRKENIHWSWKWYIYIYIFVQYLSLKILVFSSSPVVTPRLAARDWIMRAKMRPMRITQSSCIYIQKRSDTKNI